MNLRISPLTRDAFAPFGEVIETAGARRFPINNGTTTRFHDLANVDVAAGGGRAMISIFRGIPFAAPVRVRVMERHPLGSQAFIPMACARFLIVVAAPGDPPGLDDLRGFIGNGRQGVNYARGVWHHPLLTLEQESDFLIVDRGGDGHNCDEIELPEGGMVIADIPAMGG